jgi:predicted nucleic acid-binding protein
MSNNNMVTRKWSKQNVQDVLKSLRNAKTKEGKKIFNVVKKDSIYEVKANKDNQLVFGAMVGRFDYLVTFDKRLFS